MRRHDVDDVHVVVSVRLSSEMHTPRGIYDSKDLVDHTTADDTTTTTTRAMIRPTTAQQQSRRIRRHSSSLCKSNDRRRRRRNNNVLLLYICLLFLIYVSFQQVSADDDLLQELLEEERRLEEERMSQEDSFQYDDEYIQQRQEEERLREEEAHRKQQEALRKQQEGQAEQIRLQREQDFERELAKLQNDKDRKVALKQKRRDAKIVNRILKAFEKEQHYTVLGLPPSWLQEWSYVRIVAFKGQEIGWQAFALTTAHIRKAYRRQSKAVHPDKNKDGRAQEAFVAVETSASLLTDETQRRLYDEALKQVRIAQRQHILKAIQRVTNTLQRAFAKVSWIFKRIVGPFATPILILLALIL